MALVALLGVLCWIAYYRTRSLWASIVLHWLVVVTWKAFSGTSFTF
ncbi:MAG: CPBP family glutamic-type intramembrane protease [Cyanobacteria bacterium P01_D01_bin.123]